MLSIHKCLLSAGFAVCLAVSLQAGLGAATAAAAEPSESEAAARAVALARERLKLNDEQVERVRPLFESHVKNLRALFEEYARQGAAVLPSFMQEFKETRDGFQFSMEPILSEEQRQEFVVVRKEVDHALRDLIYDHRVAVLKDRLKLKDEQVAAVRPIISDDFERKWEILSFHTSQTGGPRTRRPLGPEYQKIQDETERRLQGVLTADQMKAYSAYLEEQRQATSRAVTTGR